MASAQISGGPVCVRVHKGAEACLVMGMRWMPVLGADAKAQVWRRARVDSATHATLSMSSMGGWVRVPQAYRNKAVYSAALAYARLNPAGTVLSLLPLADGRLWAVAVHAGGVLADGDRVCANEQDAEHWRAAMLVRFPQMRQISVALDDLCSSLDDATRLFVRQGLWQRLPLPLKVLPFALALTYGWQHGPALWRQMFDAPAELPQIDAKTAWRQAQIQASQNLPLHGESDLRAVLSALTRLPVAVTGWELRNAACRVQLAGWDCRADYARTGYAARNATLAGWVPDGWQLEFGLLDSATLRWHQKHAGRSLAELDLATLPTPQDTEVTYASRLQAMQPAFGLIGIGDATNVPVAAPIGGDGQPLPSPIDLPVLKERTFSAVGPLRSFVLLSQSPPPMAWRELSLEITPERGAGVALSRLAARLQGVLYEKH